MKKFEYRYEDISMSIDSLNDMGENGWELCAAIDNSLIFKREIESDSPSVQQIIQEELEKRNLTELDLEDKIINIVRNKVLTD